MTETAFLNMLSGGRLSAGTEKRSRIQRYPESQTSFSTATPSGFWDLSRRTLGSSVGQGIEDPPNLDALMSAAEKSRELLLLRDDWDGEGGRGYDKETWQRAIIFLFLEYINAYNYLRLVIPVPKIQAGPDGSIDLYWKTPSTELLVNFPAEIDESVSYYGDNSYGQKVKGSLNLHVSNLWLMMWLTQ